MPSRYLLLVLLLGRTLTILGQEVAPVRGWYEQPVTVRVAATTPGSRLVMTTNGTAPSATNGTTYQSPLRVATPTVLRVAQLDASGAVASQVVHTYLFAHEVARQTGAGWPTAWGRTNGQPVQADYAMDPEIVTNAAYAGLIAPALKSLATLSVAFAPGDFFDDARGIYANPMESGAAWERPASLEMFHPDGRPGFQVPCGIRIQGGWNRRPEECPKHSFRVVFKKKYGPGKLKHPIFDDFGVKSFDALMLRGGCNNTWLHWRGEERAQGDYLRDEWMRRTAAAMGMPAARGRFVQLFLNGLYWGLYNLTERPDDAFIAAREGGSGADYDARNGANILSGNTDAWDRLFKLANAGLRSDAAYQQVEALLNIERFCDYMLLNFYGANADWDRSSNWYAARRRAPAGLLQFFVWDGERTLEQIADNSLATDDDQSPARLFHRLRENAGFRGRFAERARKHTANGGALSPLHARLRFEQLAREIELAVVTESARWGDYRRDVHPYKTGPYLLYTRNDHWQPEVHRLLGDYFPARTGVLLRQLAAAGLLE